jgi:hypothetical protein
MIERLPVPETDQPGNSSFAPPYVSFRTLLNAIERMESDGTPSRLDRSYLSNLPWSTQNHFLAACRSLQLIDDGGRPNPVLIGLIEEPQERPVVFGTIIRDFYAGPMSLSKNATQAELEERFKDYGISGSTARKAIAFFLHAAAYAGLPLSPHFRSPRTTERSPAKRGKRAKPSSANAGDETGTDAATPATSPLRLHPFIEGLLRELPENGATWSADKRDRWLQMAQLTVDMLYSVEPQE